jgi:hypothetical protein
MSLGGGVIVPGSDPMCRMNCRYQTVLAVYDGQGRPQWYRQLNPFRGQFGSISVDNAGVVVGGSVLGAVDLDNDGELDANTYADGGTYAGAVVARYRHDSSLAWSKSWGSADQEHRGVTTVGSRSDGEIIVAGNFSGTLNVDGTTLSSTYTQTSDIFLVRLESDGTKLWTKRLGGSATGQRFVVGADLDVDGHVAITGRFSRSIYIGSTIYAKGAHDMFLAKFTPKTGATAWKKSFPNAIPKALHVTPNNQRILVGGAIEGTTDFGRGAISSQGEDGFVTRFYP